MRATGVVVALTAALLVGNPLSGLNSAPEMLPRGWGGATIAIAVLTCWAVVGLLIIVIGMQRGAMQSISPADSLDRCDTQPNLFAARPVRAVAR